MASFASRTVLVTGGGSGIGAATARAFAAEGAAVIIADLNLANAQTVAAGLASSSGGVLAVQIDVANPQSVEQAFAAAEQWRGRGIDILVNSAGLMGLAPIVDYPFEEWNRILNVNVTGSFLCAQRAAKGMVKNGYGRIVNIASISAVRAGVGRAAYGTSKAAVAGLTRQLAMELGPHGVTANSIAPGPVVTPMTQQSYDAQTIATYTSMIPARRFGTVEEMADAILFLSSGKAGFINGEMLAVDGGYLAGGIARTGTISES